MKTSHLYFLAILTIIAIAGCTSSTPQAPVDEKDNTQDRGAQAIDIQVPAPDAPEGVIEKVVNTEETKEVNEETPKQTEEVPESSTTETQVRTTNSGFEPRTITINAGDTVTFANNDGVARWPASNRHPIHTNYPADYSGNSYGGLRSCSSEGNPKVGAFDACKRLSAGEQFSFTFNEVGTWFYHDHTNSAVSGTVIIE